MFLLLIIIFQVFQNKIDDLKPETSVGKEKICNLTDIWNTLNWDSREYRRRRIWREWFWLSVYKHTKPVYLLYYHIKNLTSGSLPCNLLTL